MLLSHPLSKARYLPSHQQKEPLQCPRFSYLFPGQGRKGQHLLSDAWPAQCHEDRPSDPRARAPRRSPRRGRNPRAFLLFLSLNEKGRETAGGGGRTFCSATQASSAASRFLSAVLGAGAGQTGPWETVGGARGPPLVTDRRHLRPARPAPRAHPHTPPPRDPGFPARPPSLTPLRNTGTRTRDAAGGWAPAPGWDTGRFSPHAGRSAMKAPRPQNVQRKCVMGLTCHMDCSATRKPRPLWGPLLGITSLLRSI